ncbi:unnamed protein product [Amoebophrya sp. A120]|nr:unnamed protein product [Amoebophrya sp. A120]|eukprot:GSA120T00000862001.1
MFSINPGVAGNMQNQCVQLPDTIALETGIHSMELKHCDKSGWFQQRVVNMENAASSTSGKTSPYLETVDLMTHPSQHLATTEKGSFVLYTDETCGFGEVNSTNTTNDTAQLGVPEPIHTTLYEAQSYGVCESSFPHFNSSLKADGVFSARMQCTLTSSISMNGGEPSADTVSSASTLLSDNATELNAQFALEFNNEERYFAEGVFAYDVFLDADCTQQVRVYLPADAAETQTSNASNMTDTGSSGADEEEVLNSRNTTGNGTNGSNVIGLNDTDGADGSTSTSSDASGLNVTNDTEQGSFVTFAATGTIGSSCGVEKPKTHCLFDTATLSRKCAIQLPYCGANGTRVRWQSFWDKPFSVGAPGSNAPVLIQNQFPQLYDSNDTCPSLFNFPVYQVATVGRCERLGNTQFFQKLDCTPPAPVPQNATNKTGETLLVGEEADDNLFGNETNGTNTTTSTSTTTTFVPDNKTVMNYYDYDDKFFYHDGYCISPFSVFIHRGKLLVRNFFGVPDWHDTYRNQTRFQLQVNTTGSTILRRNVVAPSAEKLALYHQQLRDSVVAQSTSSSSPSVQNNETEVEVLNPFYLHDPKYEKNDPTMYYEQVYLRDDTTDYSATINIDNEEYQHTVFVDAFDEDRMHQRMVDRLGRLNVVGFTQFDHLDFLSLLSFNDTASKATTPAGSSSSSNGTSAGGSSQAPSSSEQISFDTVTSSLPPPFPGQSGYYFYTPASSAFDHMEIPEQQRLDVVSKDQMSEDRLNITKFVDALTLLEDANFQGGGEISSSATSSSSYASNYAPKHNLDFDLQTWLEERNLTNAGAVHMAYSWDTDLKTAALFINGEEVFKLTDVQDALFENSRVRTYHTDTTPKPSPKEQHGLFSLPNPATAGIDPVIGVEEFPATVTTFTDHGLFLGDYHGSTARDASLKPPVMLHHEDPPVPWFDSRPFHYPMSRTAPEISRVRFYDQSFVQDALNATDPGTNRNVFADTLYRDESAGGCSYLPDSCRTAFDTGFDVKRLIEEHNVFVDPNLQGPDANFSSSTSAPVLSPTIFTADTEQHSPTATSAKLALQCNAGYLPPVSCGGKVFEKLRTEILQAHHWFSNTLTAKQQAAYAVNQTGKLPKNADFFPKAVFECAKNPQLDFVGGTKETLGPDLVTLAGTFDSLTSLFASASTNYGVTRYHQEKPFRLVNQDPGFQDLDYNTTEVVGYRSELQNVTVRVNDSFTGEEIDGVEEQVVQVPITQVFHRVRALQDNFLSDFSPNTDGLLLSCCDTVPDYCPPIGQIEDAKPVPNRILLTNATFPVLTYTPAVRTVARNPGKRVVSLQGDREALLADNYDLQNLTDGNLEQFKFAKLGSCAGSTAVAETGQYDRRIGSVVSVTCPPGATERQDTYTCRASNKGLPEWVLMSTGLPAPLKCIDSEQWCPLPTLIGSRIVSITDGEKFGSVLNVECFKNYETVSGFASTVCGASRYWVLESQQLNTTVTSNADVLQCLQVSTKLVRNYDNAPPPQRLNGTLSLRCQPGYVFKSGNLESFCDVTGEWYSRGTTMDKMTKLVAPQCELQVDWCPEPVGTNAYIKRYYDSPNNARGLDTRAEMGCNAGYVRKYGDAELMCNMNLVGTQGLWYSVAFQQVAATMHCELDPFFCPAIPTSASYTVLFDGGRGLGAIYRRACAEGFVRYAGDDEVVCGFEGVWKTRTGTGTNLRNAQLLSCVPIEQYCPLPQLVHGTTKNRVQKLADTAYTQCLPAFERSPQPFQTLRCEHYKGNATFTTRTGPADYQVGEFAHDGYWIVNQTNATLPPAGPHFACTARTDFCVAPAAETLVYSVMTGAALNPMGAMISFQCLTGYLPSFGSSQLFCGVAEPTPGNYVGIWIQADGIPGVPLACSGSKEVCPMLSTITPNSQGYFLLPLDRSLNSKAFMQCKMGYELNRAYTPHKPLIAHRMVYQCCVVVVNGVEQGFWSNIIGPQTNCPTTMASIPNVDSCGLISNFCPAPAIDPNMEDLENKNILTYFDPNLYFTYGARLSLSCPIRKEMVYGDPELVCTAQDDSTFPGKWRRWVASDYTTAVMDPSVNFTETEDGLGLRTIRPNFVPMACGFERQFGLKLRATYRSELLDRNDPRARAEVVDSVRYMIAQDTSDYDEEEFTGHLIPGVSGTYEFKLEVFGKAQVFLEGALLFGVESDPNRDQLVNGTTQLFDTFVSRSVYLTKEQLYALSVKYQYYVARNLDYREPYLTRAAILRLKWKTPDGVEQIVPPQFLFHSAETFPGYPIRRTVMNDPTPCLASPQVDRHRLIRPLRVDPLTNQTIGWDRWSGLLSHTKSANPQQRYNPNTACYIELTTFETRDYMFHFNLDFMDVEFSPSCVFDRVLIWKGVWRGSVGQPPRQLLCGENRTNEFLFTEKSNAFFIEFYSNEAYESTGYQINYTVTDVTTGF